MGCRSGSSSDGEATGRARGLVPGLDQSSWMAELVALVVLLQAAAVAGIDLHVVIDNAAVQKGFGLICQGFSVLSEFGFGLWALVEGLVRGRRHSTSWCPSHSKKRNWRPDRQGQSAAVWRRLNEVADLEASAAVSRHGQDKATLRQNLDAAERWSLNVLTSLRIAAREYRRQIRERFGDG